MDNNTFINFIQVLWGIEFEADYYSIHSGLLVSSIAFSFPLSSVKLNCPALASQANICTIKDQIDQSPIILELSNGKKLVLSLDFLEWFRGFTDAEGSFIIVKGLGNRFSFHFVIRLHKDDKGALDYINNTKHK
jgi:hypothetical protein